jgi:hypothetical protein
MAGKQFDPQCAEGFSVTSHGAENGCSCASENYPGL